MKPIWSLLAAVLILFCLPVVATDEQTITVTNSSLVKSAVQVTVTSGAKRSDLVCHTTDPSCAQPPPGEYRVVRAAGVDAVYQDCTNVVLYRLSGDVREKVGVYCWLGSGDCYAYTCSPVQVETIPANTNKHSWDVLMNMPEAKDAASRLLGHCGDAETQDVMNACFALEFDNANREMNSTLEAMLRQLDEKDQTGARAAQKAWLQYRDLHCQTIGAIRVGGGSLEPTEVNSCKTDLTKVRTKEINDGYRVPQER